MTNALSLRMWSLICGLSISLLLGCDQGSPVPSPPPAVPDGLILGAKPPATWTIDLGEVDPGFATTKTVTVRNPGNAPLTIKSWTTSCECTSVEGTPLTIAPGKSAELKVTTDTKHEPDFRGSLAIEVQLEADKDVLGKISVLITVKAQAAPADGTSPVPAPLLPQPEPKP